VKVLGSWNNKYVEVRGVRTHYLEAGSDQTLLLIHGGNLLACAEINWASVIPLFARNFHVLAPDQIGFGYTPIPDKDYSLKARGDHLIAFLETLGTSAVHVVGNSHGGWLGIYMGLKRPDLIKKLVVINSGSASWVFTPDVEKDFPFWFDDYKISPTRETAREELLRMTLRKEFVTLEMIDKGYEVAIRNFQTHKLRMDATHSTWHLANENHSLNGKHISEHVSGLRIPVLLAWSEHDSMAPLEKGIDLLYKLEQAEMHVFNQAGHHVMVDQPRRFASVIANFLNE